MIWVKELLRALGILMLVMLAWTACAIIAQDARQWHIEILP